jgi:hypothetical protein
MDVNSENSDFSGKESIAAMKGALAGFAPLGPRPLNEPFIFARKKHTYVRT